MSVAADIDELRRALGRPLTAITAGGFRPSGADDECWIGRCSVFAADEDLPTSTDGTAMRPLAQFHVPSLPERSALLDDVEYLTVFISDPLPAPGAPMGDGWIIREYPSDAGIVGAVRQAAGWKALPLRLQGGGVDYPVWDGGMPVDIESQIADLEDTGVIDDYTDIAEHVYGHKFGGWPTFVQSGGDTVHDFDDDDFEFVFQIDSDEKVGLNVVDGGSLQFWKHRTDGRWALNYDFL